MAVGRYMAVSHPFHVKPLIDVRSTRSTIMAIFVVSFVVNVPRFFENDVQSIPCRSRRGKVACEVRLSKTLQGQELLTGPFTSKCP